MMAQTSKEANVRVGVWTEYIEEKNEVTSARTLTTHVGYCSPV